MARNAWAPCGVADSMAALTYFHSILSTHRNALIYKRKFFSDDARNPNNDPSKIFAHDVEGKFARFEFKGGFGDYRQRSVDFSSDSRQSIDISRLQKHRHEAIHRRTSFTGQTEDQRGSAAASFLAIEQRPPHRDELKQDVVVADIGGQHRQAELLRLQEQHAVMERTQFAVFPIPLETA
jgi:hypothetical protein